MRPRREGEVTQFLQRCAEASINRDEEGNFGKTVFGELWESSFGYIYICSLPLLDTKVVMLSKCWIYQSGVHKRVSCLNI